MTTSKLPTLQALTRAILNKVLELHRGAVLRDCNKADERTERAAEDVDAQKHVLSLENERLRTLKGKLDIAEAEANNQWAKAAAELNSLPPYFPG